MVKISIRDIVLGADSVEQGNVISNVLADALDGNDVVALSFHSFGSASSSFVSAALIPALRALGAPEFKRRVRIGDVSWQVADVIKRRVALELEPA